MLSLVFGGEMMKIAIRCTGLLGGSYVIQKNGDLLKARPKQGCSFT
jgi:hypothetical protein